MSVREAVSPAVPETGPVLAGITTASSADDVLRTGFGEADRRHVPLRVLITGPAAGEAAAQEPIARWSEKYPDVAVAVSTAGGVDPAITLTAATSTCGLAVLSAAADGRQAALVRAVTRRAHCPVRAA